MLELTPPPDPAGKHIIFFLRVINQRKNKHDRIETFWRVFEEDFRNVKTGDLSKRKYDLS